MCTISHTVFSLIKYKCTLFRYMNACQMSIFFLSGLIKNALQVICEFFHLKNH